MPTLRNWCIATSDPYKAPEQARLSGLVYDHPNFEDGDFVHTSRVVGKRGDTVLTVSGSEYTLEDVDPAYLAAFPGARERLFASLPEVS